MYILLFITPVTYLVSRRKVASTVRPVYGQARELSPLGGELGYLDPGQKLNRVTDWFTWRSLV